MTFYIKNISCIALTYLLLCLGSTAIAQPNWSVNPPDYQYTMTFIGVGTVSCSETIDENDLVAAFIDGECRGVQSFGTDINGRKFAYLIVYDDLVVGNEVTFMLYDASEDVVVETVISTIFEENAALGDTETPYEFTTLQLVDFFITTDTISENALQGDIVAEVFGINEVGDTVAVDIGFENDALGVDNYYFTAVDNKLILDVDVDSEEKDIYLIHLNIPSLDELCGITRFFIISVAIVEIPAIGLLDPLVYVTENEPDGMLVTTFVASDESPTNSYTFELTDDPINWPDREAFKLSDNELYSLVVFDYETKSEYYVQVELTDNVGNTWLDTLTVEVLDVVELGNLQVSNLITPNGDSFNDYFELPNVNLFDDYRLVIYNDNGNEVFVSERSYDNSWNGVNNNGQELPSGAYYFMLRDRNDARNSFVGDLYIYRQE